MSSKSDLRLAIKERLLRLTPKDRDIESRVICKELRKLLSQTPHILAAFMPYSDEPDIAPVLTEFLAQGYALCMPAVENNTLVMRVVHSLSNMHRNPATGIMEAKESCLRADKASITAAIIPGRAFTASGNRMGRGNGGYDYWIAAQRTRNPQTQCIGVCFECQILQEIPMDDHDQRVDMVITARGVIKN